MAVVKFTLNIEEIVSDLRRWLSDPATRKKIARKIDDWTETGLVDKIDIVLIEKGLKDLLKAVHEKSIGPPEPEARNDTR